MSIWDLTYVRAQTFPLAGLSMVRAVRVRARALDCDGNQDALQESGESALQPESTCAISLHRKHSGHAAYRCISPSMPAVAACVRSCSCKIRLAVAAASANSGAATAESDADVQCAASDVCDLETIGFQIGDGLLRHSGNEWDMRHQNHSQNHASVTSISDIHLRYEIEV